MRSPTITDVSAHAAYMSCLSHFWFNFTETNPQLTRTIETFKCNLAGPSKRVHFTITDVSAPVLYYFQSYHQSPDSRKGHMIKSYQEKYDQNFSGKI